jgi:hypothetical protein
VCLKKTPHNRSLFGSKMYFCKTKTERNDRNKKYIEKFRTVAGAEKH